MKGWAVWTFSHVQNIWGTELCLSRPGNSRVQNYFPGALWKGESLPENVPIRFLSSEREAPPLLCTCGASNCLFRPRLRQGPRGAGTHHFHQTLISTWFVAQPSQHMHANTAAVQIPGVSGLLCEQPGGCDTRYCCSFLGPTLQPQAFCGLSPTQTWLHDKGTKLEGCRTPPLDAREGGPKGIYPWKDPLRNGRGQ